MTIIEDRLIEFTLERGSHEPNDTGHMCLLEAVAWVAGEKWSDQPQCVDPVLAAFGRAWNDGLDDADDHVACRADCWGSKSSPDRGTD